MSITLIIIGSLSIAAIWLYYLKAIDLFETEKPIYIVFTFLLGSVLPAIIFPLHSFIFLPLGIKESTHPIFSFLYYCLAVGLVEELIKVATVFILLKIFRRAVNEPFDYIKYACVSALGFAFGENVLYALEYGHHVLVVRSVVSAPAHMFFSSITIYGYVLYKSKNQPMSVLFQYVVYGFLGHGLFDFFLTMKPQGLGILLNTVLYLQLINVFVVILNNSLNQSPFYTPKKAINQVQVRKILFKSYFLMIVFFFVTVAAFESAEEFIGALIYLLFFDSLMLYVLIVRISRLSLVPGHLEPVKFQFPFYRKEKVTRDDFMLFGALAIRGDSYNDYYISLLVNEHIQVIPLSIRKSYLQKTHLGRIEQKIHGKTSPSYILKTKAIGSEAYENTFVLIAKTSGITHSENNDPIGGIFSINSRNKKELYFHEWVVLKKIK